VTPIETNEVSNGSNGSNESETSWSGEWSKWGKSEVAPLADSIALPYLRPRVHAQGALWPHLIGA
jgi:hypothetical protein